MKTLLVMLKDGLIHDENDKRPPPIGKNKKVPGPFKDDLGGEIMIEFCARRSKVYTYLIDDYDDDYEDKTRS